MSKNTTMTPQIFLAAPTDAEAADFMTELEGALNAAPVAALFLPRGERDEAAYKDFVRTVLPLAQENDCAVLVDNDAELAWELAADGAHMSSGLKKFEAALASLKPDLIVGAGDLHSRHDAMSKGELGADYVLYGNIEGAADAEAASEAVWWSQTFEVPCVLFEPDDALIDDFPCEFIGLGNAVWTDPQGPAAALSDIARRIGLLETAA